ncbi:hypothetical protein P9112_001016 [Eukaryota sp. TZLM1-RC]
MVLLSEDASGFQTLLCEVCEKTFVRQRQRGRLPHACPSCKQTFPAALPKKTTYLPEDSSPDVVKATVCETCGNEFVHSSRGKPPRNCSECREVKPEPKILMCKDCGREFEHSKQGRAPLTCPDCKDLELDFPIKRKRRHADLVPMTSVQPSVSSMTIDDMYRNIELIKKELATLENNIKPKRDLNQHLKREVSTWSLLIQKLRILYPDAHSFASNQFIRAIR